jgi:Zn-dependent peptidase ImmA (M78 family)
VFRTNGYAGQWQIPKTDPILGFCLFDAMCPVIVVKKQDAESRQTFTLFHELGHLLLHKASSIDEEADVHSRVARESAVNRFAGHVLVPDELLHAIDDNARPDDVGEYEAWLNDARTASGASMDAILIRLIEVGRLAQARYDAYDAFRKRRPAALPERRGNRMYRHREPKHMFGDRFVRLVLDALRERHITLPRASRYLDNLKVTDLRSLERHYADL